MYGFQKTLIGAGAYTRHRAAVYKHSWQDFQSRHAIVQLHMKHKQVAVFNHQQDCLFYETLLLCTLGTLTTLHGQEYCGRHEWLITISTCCISHSYVGSCSIQVLRPFIVRYLALTLVRSLNRRSYNRIISRWAKDGGDRLWCRFSQNIS